MIQLLRFKYLKCILLLVLVTIFFFEIPHKYAQGQTYSWSIPINFSEQPETFSCTPHMICDQYQNLHVFWGERLDSDGAPLSLLFYKNDIGGVWSEPIDLLVTDTFEELHAAITPDDMIHLVWSNFYKEVVYFRAALSSASQIKQWDDPVILANEAYNSNFFIDKDGILYVIFTTSDELALSHGIYYIFSNDSGETWSRSIEITQVDTPLPSSVSAQLMVDGKGRFHVVYTARSIGYGEYSHLQYLRFIDSTESWDSTLIFPSSTTFQGVNMLAEYLFGDDEIHLTYDIPERLHQWSYDGGETWSQPIPIVQGVELGAAFGGYNQLVKDGSGTLHVVFAARRGVFYSTLNGLDWSSGELIDSPSFDPHGQQMALCQGNRLSVLYGGNDEKSEIWYSEKRLNLPRINRSLIPTTKPTSTLMMTPITNMNKIETPIPTTVAINPPEHQQIQSSSSLITIPAIIVIIIISTILIYKKIHPTI